MSCQPLFHDDLPIMTDVWQNGVTRRPVQSAMDVPVRFNRYYLFHALSGTEYAGRSRRVIREQSGVG
jgi:hypothetical protein